MEDKMKDDQIPVQKATPKQLREAESYITGLSKLLHGKGSNKQVLEMLKGGEPSKMIPMTALTVNSMMEKNLKSMPSLDTLLVGGQFLVGDLIEIGNSAGIFLLQTEEEIMPIMQDTIQQYIEEGLEKGTIDPVELQSKVEPMMTPDQHASGMRAAGEGGLPEEPTGNTAMQSYGAKMQRKGMLTGNREGRTQAAKQVRGNPQGAPQAVQGGA